MSTEVIVSKKDMGARLTAARLGQGLSVHQLAKNVGIGYSTVSRLENGANVTRDPMLKVANALGLPHNVIESASRLYKQWPGEYGKGRSHKSTKRRRRTSPATNGTVTPVSTPPNTGDGFTVHHETAFALLREAREMLKNGRSNKDIADRISAALVILELGS